MFRALQGLFLAGLLAAAAGCGDRPSSDQCEKLLDHMLALEAAQVGVDQAPDEQKAEAEKQRKALRDALRDDFMSQCEDDTSSAFVSCALQKKSWDKLDECDTEG